MSSLTGGGNLLINFFAESMLLLWTMLCKLKLLVVTLDVEVVVMLVLKLVLIEVVLMLSIGIDFPVVVVFKVPDFKPCSTPYF